MTGERRTALIRERLVAVGESILDGSYLRERPLQHGGLKSNRLGKCGDQFDGVSRVEVALTLPDAGHALSQLLEVKSEGFDLGRNVHRITVSVEAAGT